jgi:hypothetical protein
MDTLASQALAYVAERVQVRPLPEVGVRGVQAEGGQKRAGLVGEALASEEAVVRHVVEGLRGELFREWVEVMDM